MTASNDSQTAFQQAPAGDQQAVLMEALQGMSPEQRAELAQLLNQHPDTAVQAGVVVGLAGA